ncbi:MAG: hypothetical protein V1889_00190 [archaeon]
MSSEQISLVAEHPFVRRFVLAILQNIRANGLVHDEKFVVHADLVPKFSEKVMMASMETPKVLPKIPVVPPRVPIRKVMRVPPGGKVTQGREKLGEVGEGNFIMVPPRIMGNVGLSQDYGKITLLLNDVSVSTIECHGAGKPLIVIRAGQKQLTRIVLSADEIKNVLDKVSDSVHIPILEGVFRAAIDNFFISAVVSDIIGSRFVIKKQNAYAMLEGKF